MSLNYSSGYNQEIRSWLQKVLRFTASIQKDDLVNRPCPVCGELDGEIYANNGFLDYVRCDKCSLIYMNPSFSENSVSSRFEGDDGLLMEYFDITSVYKSIIPESPDPRTDRNLRDIYSLRQNGRLLDIGCSIGDFLHKAKYFYDVEGLEINPRTSAVAERFFKVHKGYLGQMRLKQEYDIVTLNQILYGVPDPVSLLQEIHAILKDDGLLYINSPNARSCAMDLYRGKANHLFGYTTLNVFDRDSLTELARRTGFKILTFRTEWLDIYITDLHVYYTHPEDFIHKRNCQVPNYEALIEKEDKLQCEINMDMRDKGNYFIAVLCKSN